jgi:hypothetical protein
MKKLLVITSACIIACIFFSSCGTSLSIAKRHYRKGFYVEFAKHNQAPSPVKNAEKKPSPDKRTILSYSVLKPEKRIVEMAGNIIPKPTQVQSIHKTTGGKPQLYKTVSMQNSLLTDKQTNAVTKNIAIQTGPFFTQDSEYHDDGGGRAALSLLWIIIVIILIIWLIGILAGNFGIGPVINVLLIIALILLILWLLRIA